MSWAEIQAEPTFGFTVVGLIVVFGPLIAQRLRLPGLLGLLIGGALVGPNMADVLPNFATLESIGSIGVLYLIFLAGLQLDIESFVQFRRVSAGFGLLTAFIPMMLGAAVALALGIDATAAVLVGSFWASFTLIAYPTIRRYGLSRNPAVAATVGASSITDMISLIVLALIVGAETGDTGGIRLVIEIGIGLGLLALWCFVVVPWIARWFFSGLGQERSLRFMLLLIALTSAGVVSNLVGVEPLIGAFFVGVGLNRIVPNASPLMNLTDFYGNSLFIPTFLVSVGLVFDPEVMFVWSTIRLAVGFTAALLAGKAIAAWLTGRLFRLDAAEVGLMFSVSVAQAAATLAATIIGREVGLYGDDVVNAVMVVVAISLIITSIGTSRFAPQVLPPKEDRRRVGEAILLPAAEDPDRFGNVVELAKRLSAPAGGAIQPIVIVTDTDSQSLAQGRARQTQADEVLSQAGVDADTELRIDRSVSAGLNSAAIQANSSLLLLTWPGPEGLHSRLFGNNASEIIGATSLPIGIAALHPSTDTDTPHRLALLARRHDLVPGQLPSLRIAAEIASNLHRRDQPLIIGPLAPAVITEAGITLPDHLEHRDGPDNIAAWATQHTQPGDLIILPLHDPTLRTNAIAIYNSGRSVLAINANPEPQSPLATTWTLPSRASTAPL